MVEFKDCLVLLHCNCSEFLLCIGLMLCYIHVVFNFSEHFVHNKQISLNNDP